MSVTPGFSGTMLLNLSAAASVLKGTVTKDTIVNSAYNSGLPTSYENSPNHPHDVWKIVPNAGVTIRGFAVMYPGGGEDGPALGQQCLIKTSSSNPTVNNVVWTTINQLGIVVYMVTPQFPSGPRPDGSFNPYNPNNIDQSQVPNAVGTLGAYQLNNGGNYSGYNDDQLDLDIYSEAKTKWPGAAKICFGHSDGAIFAQKRYAMRPTGVQNGWGTYVFLSGPPAYPFFPNNAYAGTNNSTARTLHIIGGQDTNIVVGPNSAHFLDTPTWAQGGEGGLSQSNVNYNPADGSGVGLFWSDWVNAFPLRVANSQPGQAVLYGDAVATGSGATACLKWDYPTAKHRFILVAQSDHVVNHLKNGMGIQNILAYSVLYAYGSI